MLCSRSSLGLVPAIFSASTRPGFGHVKIGPAHAESSAGELEHLDLLAPAVPVACYFPDEPLYSVLISATVQDWDNIFAVNTRGVFLCYKYAVEQMIKQGKGGRIIGASSIAGKKGGRRWSGFGMGFFW